MAAAAADAFEVVDGPPATKERGVGLEGGGRDEGVVVDMLGRIVFRRRGRTKLCASSYIPLSSSFAGPDDAHHAYREAHDVLRS